jgi:hypothetical protein
MKYQQLADELDEDGRASRLTPAEWRDRTSASYRPLMMTIRCSGLASSSSKCL